MTAKIAVISLADGDQPALLTDSLVANLTKSFLAAAADPAASTIVITAPEGTFLAGADVRYFARCVLSGDLDRLLRFTRDGQQLLNSIQHCDKPVVAWVRGPAIGAGLELALACRHVVAGPRAKFSFPETGLGIYPGLGGTQRTPRRIGKGLAKWMIFSGAMLSSDHAAEIGLIDAACPSATAVQDALDALATAATRRDPSPRFTALEQFFSAHVIATMCDPGFPLPADPHLARVVVQVRSKGPIALRLAESIIDRGMAASLAQGLELEFSHLREVFSTEDARRGLLSMGAERVEFAGR